MENGSLFTVHHSRKDKMGLAASQAQLLTIVSRLTDTELRTQSISEERKNLAIASAEVAEKYYNALDEQKIMFTNYGAGNVKKQQELTYSAMTNYNPYNNQYGLANVSQQLLVSEAEADNFKAAMATSDPLKTFIEMHGLEYKTNFWDNLETHLNAGGNILYRDIDANGEIVEQDSGLTLDQFKTMYEGPDRDSFLDKFNSFTTLAGEYNAQLATYNYNLAIYPTAANADNIDRAKTDLAKFLYGASTTRTNYDEMCKASWLMANPTGLTMDGQQVISGYQFLKITDTYGEPAYAWIDKTDQNANGEKKAEWFENLFNRMKQGFAALEDGLASSPEWIKYQLENGLVQIEQVNEKQEWSSFIYTKCADINAVTSNVDAANAEAEYERALNKIQDKDKRLEMESKRIETEHNSLQTEYESIKAALTKNIERSFKIYNA